MTRRQLGVITDGRAVVLSHAEPMTQPPVVIIDGTTCIAP